MEEDFAGSDDSEEFEEIPLDRQRILHLIQVLFIVIDENSLNDVETTFLYLTPNQRTQILNSSIRGYTLLYHAISTNRFEIASHLLGISLRQGQGEMCDAWKRSRHPLNAAIASGNRQFVALVATFVLNLNEYFYGPYTPLMKATFSGNIEVVIPLLRYGAEVDQPCSNGTTPLMASTVNGLLRFFIDINADLDLQEKDGLTALHIAISNEALDSVIFLVNAGASVRICTNQGLMPLMWAAVSGKTAAVKYLSQHSDYSELEIIEASEALNAFYVCSGLYRIECWSQALKRRDGRFPKKNGNRHIVFGKEFSTEAELQELVNRPLQLAFQGMLVIERTTGIDTDIYLGFLLKTALIALRKRNFRKLSKIIYLIKDNYQKYPPTFFAACSHSFKIIFDNIADSDSPENLIRRGGYTLFEITVYSIENMWSLLKEQYRTTPHFEDTNYYELFDLFLHMANTINFMYLPQTHFGHFRELVARLVKVDPRIKNLKSLLHQVISNCRYEGWCWVGLAWLLLELGAEVDSKDYFRRTPLMYVLRNLSGYHLDDMGMLLLDFSSHPDIRDDEGFPAIEYSDWRNLPILESPWSLQCLAADVILDSRVQYRGVLPKILEAFVDLHR